MATEPAVGQQVRTDAFWLLAFTLFISSALMFLVEPMIAKMVLPILGGSPMIWNTCVVFFQLALLLGYSYAWALSRWFSVLQQLAIHAVVVVVPLLVLPFSIDSQSAPGAGDNPIAWLLMRLTVSIGLPFFALSTSASLFQHWFAATSDATARQDPYHLYSVSNLGSLIGLLAYPFVLEPTLRLGDQRHYWTLAYVVFMAGAVGCAVLISGRARARRARISEQVVTSTSAGQLGWRRRLKWLALSAVPSSLMLAVTSYLSIDIAPIPLLWVVPLAIYLLTFALAFSRPGPRFRPLAQRALPLITIPIIMLVITQGTLWLIVTVALHLVGFVVAAFTCHSELAHDRPERARLTEFYFWVALGGVIGGLFNTIVAPLLFSNIIEYPLGLVFACALQTPLTSAKRIRLADRLMPGLIFLLTALLILVIGPRNISVIVAALAVPAILAFSQSREPKRFALNIAALLCAAWAFARPYGDLEFAERTFFGVYRVAVNPARTRHLLFNGTTLHGVQNIDGKDRREALTYYHRTGPIGQAFAAIPALSGSKPRVAVVGLGIGTLATYARPDEHWTFYEIDPVVEYVARNPQWFTYLSDCGSRCDVVLGDARLSLGKVGPNQFSLIVLDAFSSDAIPTHLLTEEALALYLSRLSPGGILAFHISNRHLALGPILGRLAETHGLIAVEQYQGKPSVLADGQTPSDWVFMARRREELGSLVSDSRWTPLSVRADAPLWTDDFTNILSVIMWRMPRHR